MLWSIETPRCCILPTPEPILTDKSTSNVICHYIPNDQLKDVGCSSLGLGMKVVLKRAIRGSGQEVRAAPVPAAGSQRSSQPGLWVGLAQEALKQISVGQKVLDELLNPAITARKRVQRRLQPYFVGDVFLLDNDEVIVIFLRIIFSLRC